jgi:hypothetical protein
MRRLLLPAIALAALLAVPGTAGAYPTRVQAVADEFHLTLSRLSVPHKRVRIQLVNLGEDPHDLRLRRFHRSRTFVIPETLPGEQRTRTFRLRPGRYHVWCSVSDHHELGMRATLRVRR